MPKATITLPNGTLVNIEGTPEDINRILKLYSGSENKVQISEKKKDTRKSEVTEQGRQKGNSNIDHAQIINKIKDSDEAIKIEKQVLDKPSQVNRILLPLYIVHEYFSNSISLTSGDINKITTDLGIPISRVNASHTLSGTASRYVIGDKVRKKGKTVRYKLSRRGLLFMKSVLSGAPDDHSA